MGARTSGESPPPTATTSAGSDRPQPGEFGSQAAPSELAASVVVVAYHRPKLLGPLLEELQAPFLELIVVNVEEDPEVAAVAEAWGATVVPVAGNPGYAAAVNRGAEAARAGVVVFSNDDVSFDALTARELGAVVSGGGSDVAVPRIVDRSGQTVRTIQALPSLRSLCRDWLLLPDEPVGWLSRWLVVEKWRAPMSREAVQAASAVTVAVRSDLLRKIPVPEAYFLYWEEAEWFALLARSGVRVLYVAEVTVVHEGGRLVTSATKSALLARNAVRCIRRLDGVRSARLAYVVILAWQARLVASALVRRAIRHPRDRSLLAARRAGLRAALRAWPETRTP